MRRYLTWAGGLVLGLGLWLAAQPAGAVITRLTQLADMLTESDFLFTAQVEKINADAEKPTLVLTVDENLRGKAGEAIPFTKLRIDLTGDREAKKDGHTDKLLKRLAP